MATKSRKRKSWRCFHCDEVFRSRKSAWAHFGPDQECEKLPPACVDPLRTDEKTRLTELREAQQYAFECQESANNAEDMANRIESELDEFKALTKCDSIQALRMAIDSAQGELLAGAGFPLCRPGSLAFRGDEKPETKGEAMEQLIEYIQQHTMRGECQCGKCADKGPDRSAPAHSVDVFFFWVSAVGEPTKEELLAHLTRDYPNMERLKGGPSYIEIGGALGDQGLALRLIGLGALVQLWPVITPNTLGFPAEEGKALAGQGFVMAGGFGQ